MTSSTEISLSPALPGVELAKQILHRLFLNFDGSLRVCLWDGSVVNLGHEAPAFSLIFRSVRAFREFVLVRDPLRLAESYFKELIDIDGDLYSALKLRHHLSSLQLSLTEKAELVAKAFRIKSDKTALNDSDAPANSRARLSMTSW